MKAVNLFVPCAGDNLIRLEEEYNMLGRHTLRVEGGLSVLAYPPVKPKAKKKVEPRKKRRDEDEEKVKPSRDQKPKRA